jgi:pimeloyl-ACP methyl ester carboxylesterase
MKFYLGLFLTFLVCNFCSAQVATDSIVLRDIEWDKTAPATLKELQIPSNGSLMQGFIYKANGKQKHPTLLLLHGYPGNERNLDLAQVVRAHGWNVIYFNYRGAWGGQGKFGFENCVQDVVNVVGFCKKYQDSLQIDTTNIVLFGHSMGGWVCLKALQQLPTIKKGFALSTWDIYGDLKNAHSETELIKMAAYGGEYFVLNSSIKEIFTPILKKPGYFDLENDGKALANKQIIMLDEHPFNKKIAEAIKKENKTYFDYQTWQTDHPFSNKRIALMKLVLSFLDK